MADIRNVRLGVCDVIYKGVNLGHSIGGVVVTYAPEFHDTSVDKYGKTIVEKTLIGESLSATFSLAEYVFSNLANAIAMGQTALAGVGDGISIGAFAGKSGRAVAGPLLLHPLTTPAAFPRIYDVMIYMAISSKEIKIEHKNDGERVIPCEFQGMIDESRVDGNLLGFIGDSLG